MGRKPRTLEFDAGELFDWSKFIVSASVIIFCESSANPTVFVPFAIIDREEAVISLRQYEKKLEVEEF